MAATHLQGGRGQVLDVWGELEPHDLAAAVASLVEDLGRGGASLVEWCPPRFGSGPEVAARAGLLRRRRGVRFARWLHRPSAELGTLADLSSYRLSEGDSDYA